MGAHLMKTTIEIADELIVRARKRAARDKTALRDADADRTMGVRDDDRG